MKPIHELCSELLDRGVVYRYPPERLEFLSSGGHPFPSPTHEVQTSTGPMIEEVIQPVLQPIVLSRPAIKHARQLASLWPPFMRAQMEIFQMARANHLPLEDCALVRAMCTDEEWEKGHIDPGYGVIHPFVRLDALLIDECWKVLDINSTRPAGVGDIIAHQAMVNGNIDPLVHSLPMGAAFAHVVRQCVDDWASKRHLPGESVGVNIVVRERDGDWKNFENLRRALTGSGLNAQLIEPDQLKLGEPTAVIRSRIKEGDPAYEILKAGYPDERCVLSPLFRRFIGNKMWMYLFSIEPFASLFRGRLGPGYAILKGAFPEIGVIDGVEVRFPDRKVPLASLKRDEWVLKDPAGSSGRRMYLGCRTGKGKWQELISRAQDGWIAQQFYPAEERLTVAGADGEPTERKLYTKHGLYLFDGVLAGMEFNARPDPVVHGARNTYMNPVYYRE
ncbi:MAG: hypothetical protein A2898_05665 [Candidatus Kerfeldbacteria bacterium RIFCSPLOWO2_01_FULL_48_11]|uniref:Glutathionylspermidine synthase pre-ATP-grasp-like domain-containing protein n=1 Tax=Candidatus Kerfeldbacteria bacterium RIFCSPLOWO2_01_FULL_48_11 TaxID=1798543 RepID=A0A1G2B4J5_9BACT|nr:MAG: hypothetical protein UY34_C0035G0006 [Parcubacteria group bacterium GW2011_GWA2_48_9]KKW15730.1 MAG: hypothetical protein UY52_C0015G0015 [Parcubacteria group bacterium GW2011_GWC2_49_9]OGY83646.1 MAG: hypothetical protein A2898_05665 [Candidatus Kerfeldbacteria bacterium RIFCSPLOWO2_01_FULL_48_11]HCM68193.1 hypothetical protein [Candidatus Kerfeldbacteria bacterium]